MKRTFTSLMLAVGMVSLFVSTPVFAQTNPAVAQIPFSFEASGKTLPAGQYNVSQFDSNSAVFTVQNVHGQAVFATLGKRQTGYPDHPSMTFMRSGGQWMLVKITPPNSLTAYSLGPDAIEHNKKLELATMVSIKLK